MKKKFTREELSRILGAQSNDQMEPGGSYKFNTEGLGCINQHAYNNSNPMNAISENINAAEWFDDKYDPDWSEDQLLEQLDKQGLCED